MKSKILSTASIDFIKDSDASATELASLLNVSRRTINRVRDGEISEGYDTPEAKDLSDYYGSLTRKNQRLADLNNNMRKQTRESARADNVVIELTKELTDVISQNAFSVRSQLKTHKHDDSKPVGIIHLSDLHFGERVIGVNGNNYDLSILAARLRKYCHKATALFKAQGITDVFIASTGDMINSDRRMDEIMSNANNRSKVLTCAVDMLQQFIVDLNQNFNVTLASVCGNESRIGEYIGWSDKSASENYDHTIHFVLECIFKDSPVNVLPMSHPLEQVVDVNGMNILLIHGHNKTATTAKAETEVSKIRSKYAVHGVNIDYVIFGNIHATYISDWFARGSSTVGANGYSENGLNLTSRAAQNCYIVNSDKSIDAIKIDLQHYDIDFGYHVNPDVEEYKPSHGQSATVVIQKVLI